LTPEGWRWTNVSTAIHEASLQTGPTRLRGNFVTRVGGKVAFVSFRWGFAVLLAHFQWLASPGFDLLALKGFFVAAVVETVSCSVIANAFERIIS